MAIVNIDQSTLEQLAGEQVTLVIPSTGGATDLQRFIDQVGELLEARILKMTGSWQETSITLKLPRPGDRTNVVDKLMKMPEVEEAEEKKLPKNGDTPRTGILVILGADSDNDGHKEDRLISQGADLN